MCILQKKTGLFSLVGPSLPKGIYGHEMIRVGYDLLTFGGVSSGLHSNYIFKLSCINHICQWEVLYQKLKIPRSWSVAIAVPDDFIECH